MGDISGESRDGRDVVVICAARIHVYRKLVSNGIWAWRVIR